MSQARRGLWLAGAVLALQAAAVLVYRYVEERRRAPHFAPFRLERLEAAVALPPLPNVALQRADGSLLPFESLRARPVLVHFWATWCPPCREELPGLLQLAQREQQLTVVALSLDDDWAAVQRFFAGPVPAEVFREPSGSLLRSFGVGELPDTFLLERGARPVLRFAGARDWRSDAARAALLPYLR